MLCFLGHNLSTTNAERSIVGSIFQRNKKLLLGVGTMDPMT